eukprot:gnl/MRDRNA2_/MRDRNA2_96834_c0_seq1.p1 gnl/MRDRNA2_/MRDRNA2_96834_c0~~gnl/MRDRNA2_/MRDRNA2_96834_c0_seq1.p1  ORF type:complete len:1087 (+),score=224.62 gnl/MRDRNA2_/MRDRNA2_96834_c0_seq1:114-3374(+)
MPPKSFDIEDAVAKLRKCPLFEKLNTGDLASISRDEVVALFNILDADGTGSISVEDLQMLSQVPDLKVKPEDLQQIIADCDKSGDGLVDIDEMYKALTQGTLSFNNLVAGLKGASTIKKDECTRTQLMDYMNDEYQRYDALCSLPWALTLFLMFLLCLQEHLQPEVAYSMRSALEGEISGEGGRSNHEGPFLERDVHDVPTFWDWMQASLISGCFKNDLQGLFPYPGRIASYNQIVGGIVVTPTATVPVPCSQAPPLLDVFDSFKGPGYCHGDGSDDHPTESSSEENTVVLFYHMDLEEVRKEIFGLMDKKWVNQNISAVDVAMLMYNGNLGMFTHLILTFSFQRDGFIKIAYNSESWLADPYFSKAVILCDLLFGILILKMAWAESKEMFPALQNGLDGFLDYWEFWNAVDWAAILGGLVLVAMWGSVCSMVSGDLQNTISSLPLKILDKEVHETNQFLTRDALDKLVGFDALKGKVLDVHEIAGNIAGLYYLMRWMSAVYSVILMLKFFKAFKANPRLNIVTQTLIDGSVDIVHFFLVFFVIFLCFAVMATVLFGHKIRTFSSFSHSMAMCWRILMGDFDYEEMEAVDWIMTVLWFSWYQIIVFLILFNMLLAIVMDTYGGVKASTENPEKIWNQVVDTLRKTQKTRGHLSLWYLICEFEDDDFPAHPDNCVTPKSLRKAFNKMSKHNAEYLVAMTNEWVVLQEGHTDLTISDAIRLVGRVDSIVGKIQNTTFLIYEKIKEEARKPMEKRLDMIMAGEDPEMMGVGMKNGHGGYMNGHEGGHPMGHGGMVRAAPDKNMVNAMKAMQTQLEQQSELIKRQQEYLEQRDAWIEQRIMFMERRSEKVELSAERLIAAMQKLDVDSLGQIPEQLEALNQMVGMMHSSNSGNQPQHVAQQLQSLNSQVARLNQCADEDAQARNVLYRLDVSGKQMKATQAASQNENINQLRAVGAQLNALLYHAEEDADTKRMNCKSILKQFRAAQAGGREFPLFSQNAPALPASNNNNQYQSLDNRPRGESSGSGQSNNAVGSSALRQAGAAIMDQNDESRPGSSSSQQGLPRDFPAPPPPGALPGQGAQSNRFAQEP